MSSLISIQTKIALSKHLYIDQCLNYKTLTCKVKINVIYCNVGSCELLKGRIWNMCQKDVTHILHIFINTNIQRPKYYTFYQQIHVIMRYLWLHFTLNLHIFFQNGK